MVTIFSDGATEGFNGKLGTVKFCGIGVYCPTTDFRFSDRISAGSNNEAEFYALIKALEYAIEQKFQEVEFLLDSQIVINRALGRRPTKAKWKNPRMDIFQDRVLSLIDRIPHCRFTWIPREQNQVADYLSKASLKTGAYAVRF